MIFDAILLVLQGIVNILLSPLTVLNIAIDFVASIPVITQFLQVVAYVLPFSNLMPLIILNIAIFGFRAIIALIKTVWDLLPIL